MPDGHTAGSTSPVRNLAHGRRPRWDSRRRLDAPSTPTVEAPSPPADGEPVKVNLAEKFARASEQGAPQVVGELNGQQLRLAKLLGPFVWHRHEREDELCLVVKGRLRVEFRDRTVELEEGELLVIPRGVEHRPVADAEVHVLLFEPREERTAEHLERL